MVERTFVEKGYVGETHAMAKLSRDYNTISVKIQEDFFSYGLITNNDKRLVKTPIHANSKTKHRVCITQINCKR